MFFRVCEDREIEVENTLLAILRLWQGRPGVSLYSLLNDLFKQRRALYNGLLFAPHECEELEIGDDVLLKILQGLNYPFSPYYFNEIGVEILGSIYEKFLGKTIHLTPKTVRVDEKPEVRKAGGVYYTPQYIVNYIVDNTVGKLLYEDSGSKGGKRKLKLSPKQVSKLKIIDIACGSGSFLLGAFQKLTDYHLEWYREHPKEVETVHNVPDAYGDANGNLRLSSRKKRDILLNNIYGVDIDRQAVEVTQMSLYLKVLEGENAETLNPQMMLALKEAYLPSLASNIKCGNSLIGTDISAQADLFDSEGTQKINPFDWETEFPEIMNRGGFDCVIGNPPYVRPHNLEDYAKTYYWAHYGTFVKKSDLYCCFLERAIRLVRSGGRVSYIVSDGWMRLDSFQKLRALILEECKVDQLVGLPDKVFEDANVKTGIVILQREHTLARNSAHAIEIWQFDETDSEFRRIRTIPQRIFHQTYKLVFDTGLSPEVLRLKRHVAAGTTNLGSLVDIRFGLKTGDDEKFITTKQVSNKHKPLLRGENVSRYGFEFKGEYVHYVPEEMRKHRQTARPGEPARFEQPKILIKDTSSRLGGTLDVENYYVKDVLIVTAKQTCELSLHYLLALLNSTLMRYYYESTFTTLHVQNEELASLPIHVVVLQNQLGRRMHDSLVGYVQKILELERQLQKATFDSEKEPIQRQIAATDKKIDKLVYELYGLTEEEIKIVEGG